MDWGSPRSGCSGQDPWGKPRVAAWLFPWLCLREPQAQALSTSPRQACSPRSPPLHSEPSQRPRCLQRGVENPTQALVNHSRVTRTGFRPWKEMAAFFHCMENRQGLRSGERGQGVPTPPCALTK